MLHRRAHVDVMLKELRREALVDLVLLRKLERDSHQVQTEHPHPASRVALFENYSGRMLLAAIDHSDVIESKEAAFEKIVAFAVYFVHPPREVDHQLVKTLLEPGPIGAAGPYAIHVIDSPASPRVHRRIHIRELPFISRDLAVGMLKLLEQHQPKLLLGEFGVEQRKRNGVKRKVPSGEPRILPLVGHRKNP